MPKSEEFIQGMREACSALERVIRNGVSPTAAIIVVRQGIDRLSAENDMRRIKKIEWPDGGAE